jgi:hypothetical protein
VDLHNSYSCENNLLNFSVPSDTSVKNNAAGRNYELIIMLYPYLHNFAGTYSDSFKCVTYNLTV